MTQSTELPAYRTLQGKFLKDYAAAHEALSKLGTQLPVTLYGGSAAAAAPFGLFADSYSTQEVTSSLQLSCMQAAYASLHIMLLVI